MDRLNHIKIILTNILSHQENLIILYKIIYH
uniref:Uncharacterized protein n=1 Tax=Myoviridae sp. ctCo31 TaxID=2825053 RepID=A0A8S5UMT2_9CAUD|nr:MAG TPA: hypothetical protein [Myoviridae sp. ctCo31]